MEPTKEIRQPVAVLHTDDLVMELINVLADHWLVIVEQQNEKVKIELYPKT